MAEESSWQLWVSADGTVQVTSATWSWQEWLCDPDEALTRMRQSEDDGA